MDFILLEERQAPPLFSRERVEFVITKELEDDSELPLLSRVRRGDKISMINDHLFDKIIIS